MIRKRKMNTFRPMMVTLSIGSRDFMLCDDARTATWIEYQVISTLDLIQARIILTVMNQAGSTSGAM